MAAAQLDNVQIVILAAGHGKRMKNNEVPKVLVPMHGKAMIKHLVEAIAESGVCEKPTVVVSRDGQQVRDALGDGFTFVVQDKQLGTGHAVASARSVLKGKAGHVMVLYGDHPFVTAGMIRKIAQAHQDSGVVLTMATVVLPDFNDWRGGFIDFGRVLRDGQGNVCEIIEKRDATDAQKEIREVNPSYFCFQADWLWQNLEKLTDQNAQHEYYLTDLAAIACREGHKVATVTIEPKEALGVNTPEQLELASNL